MPVWHCQWQAASAPAGPATPHTISESIRVSQAGPNLRIMTQALRHPGHDPSLSEQLSIGLS